MRACKPLPYGQLTTALVPTVHNLLASSDSLPQSPRLDKHFGVSLVLIRFVIGEMSEVGGRVGHGLVPAWFESCVCFAW